MKPAKLLLLVLLAAALLLPARAPADGTFVVPKFVWDKHKDINEPTQKAILVYDAGREDLILQVKYEGPVAEFGWLIPVPARPDVQPGSMQCFYELSQYTQRIWGGGRGTVNPSHSLDETAAPPEPPVKVVETKTVGAYEIAVLATKDAPALTQWLDANGFYFPANKTEVLDAYIKRQWYFVAVKINVAQNNQSTRPATSPGPENDDTHLKLASGELSPLLISFDTDRCIFPLKISSVNGQPSEVQVYVLSPERLLEKGMLEKRLELIYGNQLAPAAHRRLPIVYGYDLLPFTKVTRSELPGSSRSIPRLTGKSWWWLTKQSWTFQPGEMRDLEFAPAIPCVHALLNNTNPDVRAVAFLWLNDQKEPMSRAELLSVFKSPDWLAVCMACQQLRARGEKISASDAMPLLENENPDIRGDFGLLVLSQNANWSQNADRQAVEMALQLLQDPESKVRVRALKTLRTLANQPFTSSEVARFIPRFRALLHGTDPDVRAVAFLWLNLQQDPMSRNDLLSVFKTPDEGAVSAAYQQLNARGEKISDSDALPLLENENPEIRRTFGLFLLSHNADRQAVEMALPLLDDPDRSVRVRAIKTLYALTGQQFTSQQAAETWWTENKATLVVHRQPK